MPHRQPDPRPPPGSGPTDPDHVWNIVQQGAEYRGGLLNGKHLCIDTSNAWALTPGAGYTLSQAAYTALHDGTVANKLITVGSNTYQLAPMTNGVADLAAPP